jgi:hypothetical protein
MELLLNRSDIENHAVAIVKRVFKPSWSVVLT